MKIACASYAACHVGRASLTQSGCRVIEDVRHVSGSFEWFWIDRCETVVRLPPTARLAGVELEIRLLGLHRERLDTRERHMAADFPIRAACRLGATVVWVCDETGLRWQALTRCSDAGTLCLDESC